MKPASEKVTIQVDNLLLIKQFIDEVLVYQKQILSKWARVTSQSPAAKIGYIGQHLASLITGVPGTYSGARGNDLEDGTEVKSCNKIDQDDKCKACGSRVLRMHTVCPNCGSGGILRKDDSKWLFSVKDDRELEQYLHLDRILLILMDYPDFDKEIFTSIRISAFEIYPREERMSVFCDLIKNHYHNIYRPKADRGDKTNPMNLHPFSFQFYKCNPIKTFECIIYDIDEKPAIEINTYLDPLADRDNNMESLPMPSHLLKEEEWGILLQSADFDQEMRPLLHDFADTKEAFANLKAVDKAKHLPYIPEAVRGYVPLREIVAIQQKHHYRRR